MVAHPVLWASPQPLWGRFGALNAAAFTAADQRRPALLRFATDDFMEQTIAMLESDPRRIADVLARPETWRNPSGEPTQAAAVPERLPRFARALARLRAGAAAQTAVAPTAASHRTYVTGVDRTLPLKLYHPAHQRHYLVAANLVCGIPGFPDRGVAGGAGEQVGFMLRRLLPESPAAGAPEHEYAFVKDARGPHWERVAPDAAAADHDAATVRGEEMLPLFPLNFRDDVAHPRRMLAGLVPVGRREEYLSVRRFETALPAAAGGASGAPALAVTDKTRKSGRKEQLKLEVTEPWKAMIRAAYKAAARIEKEDPSKGDPISIKRASALQANEGAQLQSWLILLDFADYLAHHVPLVWDAVSRSVTVVTPAHPGRQHLLDWLNAPAAVGHWQLPSASFATSMADALRRISNPVVRAGLEGAERTFVLTRASDAAWPKFYFILAGVHAVPDASNASGARYEFRGIESALAGVAVPAPGPSSEAGGVEDVEACAPEFVTTTTISDVEQTAALVDKVVQLVVAALDADATTPAPPVPFAAQLRDALVSVGDDPGWFVIRCAYVRCDCGPLHPVVLSAPSQRFQLASFFDSDAPARPIRIALPLDTTAAGMRKHQKNTAFVISDVLCGQLNRLKGLGFVDLVLSVLPWPFHKDLDIGQDGLGPCNNGSANLGMICSLSIPIITICALILLFMIVLVLDLIFKWIPWFIICFPLPGLKAKKPA